MKQQIQSVTHKKDLGDIKWDRLHNSGKYFTYIGSIKKILLSCSGCYKFSCIQNEWEH